MGLLAPRFDVSHCKLLKSTYDMEASDRMKKYKRHGIEHFLKSTATWNHFKIDMKIAEIATRDIGIFSNRHVA